MKTSEILELIRAGYTRAEIDAMDAEDAQAAPAGQPAQEEQTQQSDFSGMLADLVRQAMTAQKPPAAQKPSAAPAPVTPPAQPAQPAPVTQPAQPAQPAQAAQQASPEDSAQRILAALGMAAQGIAIPKQETLEERMGNSLRAALGIPEPKKEGGN